MTANLVDDSAWASAESKWKRLICIQKDASDARKKVVNFSFRAYNKEIMSKMSERFGDYGLNVVEASVASLEFVFANSVLMKLVNYFLGFLDVQQLAMTLTQFPTIPAC